MAALLSLKEASLAYGGRKLFDRLNLILPADCRRCAVIGADGAGKSSLLKLMAGIVKPDSGRASLNAPKGSFGTQCACLTQDLGLYSELTVQENVDLAAALYGYDIKEAQVQHRLQGLLAAAGLAPFLDRTAGALSGGMRQKLGLCTVLCARPAVLILDEPTVGVDPLSRRELWQLITDYQGESGAALIFSTAYLEEAQASSCLLLLEQGKLTWQGSAAAFTAQADGRTFCMKAPENRAELRGLVLHLLSLTALIADAQPEGGRIKLLTVKPCSTEELAQELSAAGLSSALIDLKIRPCTAEDAFIALALPQRPRRLPQVQPPAFTLSDPAVELAGVEKRFGAFTAVAHSSFTVRRGEIFGLLGPNGAGKTTTFRMMCALLRPSAGIIKLNGLNAATQKSAARLQIGYVAQRFALYGKLTVKQNLRYFGQNCGLDGAELKARLEELSTEFQLADCMERPAALLSFGQQRSLSMACALLARPALLFLDEATSGADPLSRREFWQRILSLAQGGTTVVVTTHFMEEAEYCDRFIVQDQGRILSCMSPAEFCRTAQGMVSVEERFMQLVEHSRAAAAQEDKA